MRFIALITAMGRPARRSEQAQMERRRLERETKVAALGVARLCRLHGQSWGAIASLMRVSAETLRSWARQWRIDRLAASPRGRPLSRSRVETRNMVLAVLGIAGATAPLEMLRELFPMMGRRELEDLLARYRRVCRRRGVLLHELTWRNDGAVWAMDFTEPPAPVDGEYPQILVVRDLGSGKLLLSLPVAEATAEVVRNALLSLLVEHGVPLVIKCDNGGAFTAHEKWLLGRGVLLLVSPPYTPRFNGACEAGIGGLKVRAHHEAARHGRPGHWTCDDVETGRLIANATSRPLGATGPTPDDLWARRSRPLLEARRALIETFERCTTEERARVSDELGPNKQRQHDAAITRIALCRALVERGYLQLRRRRFTLPIESQRRSINS
jgi:transposase-like protein